jgi:hypothetical protein
LIRLKNIFSVIGVGFGLLTRTMHLFLGYPVIRALRVLPNKPPKIFGSGYISVREGDIATDKDVGR